MTRVTKQRCQTRGKGAAESAAAKLNIQCVSCTHPQPWTELESKANKRVDFRSMESTLALESREEGGLYLCSYEIEKDLKVRARPKKANVCGQKGEVIIWSGKLN